MHIAVALLRMSEGLDYEYCDEENQDSQKKPTARLPPNQSFSQLSQGKSLDNLEI